MKQALILLYIGLILTACSSNNLNPATRKVASDTTSSPRQDKLAKRMGDMFFDIYAPIRKLSELDLKLTNAGVKSFYYSSFNKLDDDRDFCFEVVDGLKGTLWKVGVYAASFFRTNSRAATYKYSDHRRCSKYRISSYLEDKEFLEYYRSRGDDYRKIALRHFYTPPSPIEKYEYFRDLPYHNYLYQLLRKPILKEKYDSGLFLTEAHRRIEIYNREAAKFHNEEYKQIDISQKYAQNEIINSLLESKKKMEIRLKNPNSSAFEVCTAYALLKVINEFIHRKDLSFYYGSYRHRSRNSVVEIEDQDVSSILPPSFVYQRSVKPIILEEFKNKVDYIAALAASWMSITIGNEGGARICRPFDLDMDIKEMGKELNEVRELANKAIMMAHENRSDIKGLKRSFALGAVFWGLASTGGLSTLTRVLSGR